MHAHSLITGAARRGWRLCGSRYVLVGVMVLFSLPYLLREDSLHTRLLVNDDLPVYFYLSRFGSACIKATGFDLGYDPRYLSGCIQTPYFTLSTYAFKALLTHITALPDTWVYYIACAALTFVVPFLVAGYARNTASLLGYDPWTANKVMLLFATFGALRSVFLHSSMLPMYAAAALSLYCYSLAAPTGTTALSWKKTLLLALVSLSGTYLHILFPVMILPAMVYVLASTKTTAAKKIAYAALVAVGALPLLKPLVLAYLSADLAVYDIPWFGMHSWAERLFYYFDFSFEHFDTLFGLFFLIPFLAALLDKGLWKAPASRFLMLSTLYLYALVAMPFFERLHSMRFEPLALGLAAGFFPLGYERIGRISWVRTALLAVMIAAVAIPAIVITIFTLEALSTWNIPGEVEEMARYLDAEAHRLNARVLMEDSEGLPEFRGLEWEESPHYRYNTHLGTYLSFFAEIPFASGYKFDYPFAFNYDRFAHGLLRGRPLAQWDLPSLEQRLEASNTALIVVWSEAAKRFFREHAPVFAERSRFAEFVVFEYLSSPHAYLVHGKGSVRTAINTIALSNVEAAAEGPLVLRFHWVAGLRADSCRIGPWPCRGQPVPLIQVEMPPGTRECTIRFDPAAFIEGRLEETRGQSGETGGLRSALNGLMRTLIKVGLSGTLR
jgi:hypothetical protein